MAIIIIMFYIMQCYQGIQHLRGISKVLLKRDIYCCFAK